MSSSLGELRRILGPLTGVAVSVGVAVGAGILRTPGEVAAALPAVPWIFAAWLIGALVATLDTLILAEMSTSVPRVGGLVAYVRLSFGPCAAFLVGWSMLLLTWPASLAAVAISVGELCVGGVDSVGADRATTPLGKAIASGVVLVAAAVNLSGLRSGSRTEIALLLLKVLLLGGVCVAVLVAVVLGHAVEPLPPAPPPPPLPEGAAALLAAFSGAMTSVVWTYDGYADAVYLSGETRDPGRAMPRALFASVATVTGLYLLANVAFVGVLGVDGLAVSAFPAVDVVRSTFGAAGGAILIAVVAAVLLGAVNAYFLTGPRIARILAEEGLALPVLGRMSDRGAARAATVLIAVLAIGYACTGTFGDLIHVMVPVMLATTGLVAAGLLVQRRRAPTRDRPFRTPAAWLVVGLQIALCAWLLRGALAYDAEHKDHLALWTDLGALAFGLLVYAAVRRRAPSRD